MRFIFSVYAAALMALTMVVLFGCGGGGGGASAAATTTPAVTTYSVSGKVVYNGVGVANVMVAIASSGTTIASQATDSSGNYTFNEPGGTYIISTTDAKYTFNPITVTVNSSAPGIPNLVASLVTPVITTYSITGKVVYNGAGVANVMVALALSGTNTSFGQATTDSTGIYTFVNATSGAYSVSSTDTKYGFISQTITVAGGDKSVPDITAYPIFTISGKIVSGADGSNPSGTMITLYKINNMSSAIYTINGFYGANPLTSVPIGTTAVSGSDGLYTFTGVISGSYTLTPTQTGFVFNPATTSAITISNDGNIYVFNPDTGSNKVINNNSIIYNSTYMSTNNVINQDFSISKPGGAIGGV